VCVCVCVCVCGVCVCVCVLCVCVCVCMCGWLIDHQVPICHSRECLRRPRPLAITG
jgi:hypothetical protein